MEQDVKVFYSKITRGLKGGINNLYELLETEPAKPIKSNDNSITNCTFQPRTDKYYEYKKKSKLKVKSVRDIRDLFENDIGTYLPVSLEKQRSTLLKKIRNGSSKDEDTKKIALNILKSENPISRTAWQMVTNINPEEHVHPRQYILWNRKDIRLSGSRGGSEKYICKYEIRNGKESLKYKKNHKKTILNKKKYLLHNSLSIKIKPGPLTQKKYIDDSYQKYHVGNIELVSLPAPGLDVIPGYGPMEPTMRNFVNSLRDKDGMISQKWAEFALSMVGTINNSNAVQLQPNVCTTFDLSYKYGQKKMLMRRDIEHVNEMSIENSRISSKTILKVDDIASEVKKIICEMIDSVEISLNQDNMYSGDDQEINTIDEAGSSVNSNIGKEKNRKKFGELDRLHVTVIRLPENVENSESEPKICKNSHCLLGCICKSLNSEVVIKGHCGRMECMFKCKCDFSNYKELDKYESVCADLMPGLLKLDKEMNLKLAKEEKKFHQTVVLSGDKRILLKPHRRSWKTSTKYSDFYKSMSLKTSKNIERNLIIVATKIICDNVEPWCMVHNLYKCFCKGRFVSTVGDTLVTTLETHNGPTIECDKNIDSELCVKSNQRHTEISLRVKQPKRPDKQTEIYSDIIDLEDPKYEHYRKTCARIQPYIGRKYNKQFYSHMNNKIREMEKDDQTLHKKLINFINSDEVDVNKSSNNFTMTSDEIEILSQKENMATKKPDIIEMSPQKENIFNKKQDEIEISPQKENISIKKRENENENSDVPNKKIKKLVGPEEDNETNHVFKKVLRAFEEIDPIPREETPELRADHIRENILAGGFATSDIQESNKSKLVAWLEYSYKQYKKRSSLGITKLTLQAPQPKKMSLLPWNFILERYKGRKNLFLVTKRKPFRMYMAVNRDHPFLQDCINIDDIRFADLYIYPITVKKLLTNASDLKDSFCILCGHAYCWELIGSVTKLDEPVNEDNFKSDSSLSCDKSLAYNENSCTESEPTISTEEEGSNNKVLETSAENNNLLSESSKWFIMTIENDFSEIQFFTRGFFVKYDSIIKAINIARYSHKTVRLSSQKCAETSSNSQFGIYAIPNSNEDCVFIGPYECSEPLGIETVKSITFTRQLKRTRGYWITTNKVDNIKVIESPMAFMPINDVNPKEILSLKSNPNEKKDSFSFIKNSTQESESDESDCSTQEKSKLMKPIINKCNNFFPLNSNSLLRLPKTAETTKVSLTDLLSKLNETTSDDASVSNLTKDDSPTISLTQPNSDSKDQENDHRNCRKNKETKTEGGIFAILKPEEINRKIMKTKIVTKSDDLIIGNKEEECQNTIDRDIENFLRNSFLPEQDSNVLVISDDEEQSTDNNEHAVDVWIECTNIDNLGWIPGRRKLFEENCLSFQFPGFNYTDFYPDEVAFNKIEQVLSRKICIPGKRKLLWRVVTNKSDLKDIRKLQCSNLGSDRVLTRVGPRRKLDLLKAISYVKTYSRKPKVGSYATAVEMQDEDAVTEVE